MQHIWEIYITLKDQEEPLHFLHVTESSRKAKTAQQVLNKLWTKRGIHQNKVERFFLEKKR